MCLSASKSALGVALAVLTRSAGSCLVGLFGVGFVGPTTKGAGLRAGGTSTGRVTAGIVIKFLVHLIVQRLNCQGYRGRFKLVRSVCSTTKMNPSDADSVNLLLKYMSRPGRSPFFAAGNHCHAPISNNTAPTIRSRSVLHVRIWFRSMLERLLPLDVKAHASLYPAQWKGCTLGFCYDLQTWRLSRGHLEHRIPSFVPHSICQLIPTGLDLSSTCGD